MNPEFKNFLMECYIVNLSGSASITYSMLPLPIYSNIERIEKAKKYNFRWMRDLNNGC
jgi:hypothetical protein